MAVTSIWPIKGRVDKVINYARNPEKTHDKERLSELHEIEGVVEYAADEMKTEKRAYVTCLNLHSEETAAQEFMETKRLMHNEGGRSCYHGYQSFKADEVDASTAHSIGVALAQELWGDRFQVVIATHCNTGHYHNHFVINSVSDVDGKKFYNSPADYRRMREVSDRLCREAKISVIEYHEGIVSPEIARAAHMMRASRYKFGSVPDVYVIDSGALKGFVSISPTWSGIDNRAFQDISRQVYNEDEFCELQRRANIMNGRTHSNVVSMTLNDYRVAPGVMFMTRSDPQLTFSQRSMKLNAVCWEKLGQQKYVEFLYHPVLEVIAVRSCNATNPNAVLWDETKKSGLQLCTSAFSNAVYDKLDWMRKYKFRFRGVTRVRGGEKIIFFFLDEPQILVGKDKKHLDAMDTSDSPVKYIPYKESECGEAAGLTAGIAYPENWQEQVGVSYEIKQQRGRVLDAVSSADIRNHGTKVVNPFIGVIPTHGELEDELEQIYEAM